MYVETQRNVSDKQRANNPILNLRLGHYPLRSERHPDWTSIFSVETRITDALNRLIAEELYCRR